MYDKRLSCIELYFNLTLAGPCAEPTHRRRPEGSRPQHLFILRPQHAHSCDNTPEVRRDQSDWRVLTWFPLLAKRIIQLSVVCWFHCLWFGTRQSIREEIEIRKAKQFLWRRTTGRSQADWLTPDGLYIDAEMVPILDSTKLPDNEDDPIVVDSSLDGIPDIPQWLVRDEWKIDITYRYCLEDDCNMCSNMTFRNWVHYIISTHDYDNQINASVYGLIYKRT